MVEYITRGALRGSVGLTEQATILRKAQSRSPNGSTFLSHSSRDLDILPGVISILEKHGADVYIDKKDEDLPPYTSQDTARILRSRVQESNKFILLASRSSKDSRWMPWELGLSDGYKSPRNVAIFPTPDQASDVAWSEQEYLGVYDRIVFGRLDGFPRDVYMVWNRSRNSGVELAQWIAR